MITTFPRRILLCSLRRALLFSRAASSLIGKCARCFALGLIVLSPGALYAQVKPVAKPEVVLAKQTNEAMSQSLAHIKEAHVGAAETQISAINVSPRNTAEWHLENATNFLRLAFTAKEEGDQAAAQRAATRALRHINLASKLAGGDPATLKRISGLRVVLSERFLSNSTEAAKERASASKNEKKSDKSLISK